MTDAKGRQCPRRAEYLVTRRDNATMQLCALDARKLRELHELHPKLFSKVRFSALVKFTPVE